MGDSDECNKDFINISDFIKLIRIEVDNQNVLIAK